MTPALFALWTLALSILALRLDLPDMELPEAWR